MSMKLLETILLFNNITKKMKKTQFSQISHVYNEEET